jgi:hypothetical protein
MQTKAMSTGASFASRCASATCSARNRSRLGAGRRQPLNQLCKNPRLLLRIACRSVAGQFVHVGVHDGQLHRLCRTGVTGDQPAIIEFRCRWTYAANQTNVHELPPNPIEILPYIRGGGLHGVYHRARVRATPLADPPCVVVPKDNDS